MRPDVAETVAFESPPDIAALDKKQLAESLLLSEFAPDHCLCFCDIMQGHSMVWSCIQAMETEKPPDSQPGGFLLLPGYF